MKYRIVSRTSPVLVDLLERDAVPMETLRERYGSLLELVRTLIGVVPNCDAYLEIWPPAFRSYNVMVPNLLNLPALIWGLGAPRATIGLVLYTASRVAGCPYCSAHTCSFALRRGATAAQVAAALDDEAGALSPADRAAVRIARALASVPARVEPGDRDELARHFSPKTIEWIVLAAGMMGWLNKTMDALGVPLELSTVAEVNAVIAPTGWTPGRHLDGAPPDGEIAHADSLLTRASVVRYAPAAIRLDRAWTADVPDRMPAVGEFLRDRIGGAFAVLSRLRHRRAIRAIATMIKDNFGDGVIGLDRKLAAGLIFADTVGNAALADELRALGAKPNDDAPSQRLAAAIAPSPAQVDAATIDACRGMAPAAIVELVAFVALLQLLHRVGSYYG
jgi:alkylhydroperoxidase family enzyme